MNILITGGCGFQGSHLAEHFLKRGCFVRIINTPSEHAHENAKYLLNKFGKDTSNLQIVWGSILDRSLLDSCMKGIEKVFHLGAKTNPDESIVDPIMFLETNAQGTKNVLDCAKQNPTVEIINSSTCEVYGANLFGTAYILESVRKYRPELTFVSSSAIFGKGSILKMNEWHPMTPGSPYAASKVAADRLCYAYYKTYGIKVKIVRPFNVYGPRQKNNGFGAFIPMSFERAMKDEHIKIFGSGKQTRDYIYIDDIIRAYHLIMECDELVGQSINIGSGEEQSIIGIADSILKLLDKPSDLIDHIDGRPGEIDSFICDNTLIEQYGFKTRVKFQDGLYMFFEWLMRKKGIWR